MPNHGRNDGRNYGPNERKSRGRIGPWRLLDIVTATLAPRSGSFALVAVAPEYGPPDVPGPWPEPAAELPGSNIGDREQHQALHREAARRFARRRPR
jgi:hypothetical protein